MRSILAVVALMIATSTVMSDDFLLPQPQGNVLLTIGGNISFANSIDNNMLFDLEMLKQLEMHVIETLTPWSDGVQQYEGPLMRDLLSIAGAKGDEVIVTALNDYSATIPVTDYDSDNVILAIKQNGEYMRVRDKGPLFIVYPFDSNPQLNNELTYSRAVWQVKSILVQ